MERVEDFEGLCRLVASEFFPPPGLARDDLMQLARIGAWKALKTFDPERRGAASLKNFVVLCAQKEIQTGLTMARRQKHLPVNDSDRFEQPLGADRDESLVLGDTIPSKGPSAHEQLLVRQDLDALVEAIAILLSPLERAALVGVVWEGRPYEDIVAAGQARSVKQIDNALQRARKKLGDRMMPTLREELEVALPAQDGIGDCQWSDAMRSMNARVLASGPPHEREDVRGVREAPAD